MATDSGEHTKTKKLAKQQKSKFEDHHFFSRSIHVDFHLLENFLSANSIITAGSSNIRKCCAVQIPRFKTHPFGGFQNRKPSFRNRKGEYKRADSVRLEANFSGKGGVSAQTCSQSFFFGVLVVINAQQRSPQNRAGELCCRSASLGTAKGSVHNR